MNSRIVKFVLERCYGHNFLLLMGYLPDLTLDTNSSVLNISWGNP